MEWLFRSLKTEWIPKLGNGSIEEANRDVGLYLMAYYNWHGPHSTNGGTPAADKEKQVNLLSVIC